MGSDGVLWSPCWDSHWWQLVWTYYMTVGFLKPAASWLQLVFAPNPALFLWFDTVKRFSPSSKIICEWSKCFVTSEEKKNPNPHQRGKSENHQREQHNTNLVGFVCQRLGKAGPKVSVTSHAKTPGSPRFVNLCVNSDKAHLMFKLGSAVVKVRQQSSSRFPELHNRGIIISVSRR